MKLKNKKGQVLDQMGTLAVGIAVLGITLVIAFLVLSNARTQSTTIGGTSVTQTNSSVTVTVGTINYTLDNCMNGFAVLAVYNDSGLTSTIASGNYSASIVNNLAAQLRITNVTAFAPTVYVNYTCIPPTYGFNSTITLTNATSTIPGWIPLIIIAFIGSLLLGLVVLIRRSQG